MLPLERTAHRGGIMPGRIIKREFSRRSLLLCPEPELAVGYIAGDLLRENGPPAMTGLLTEKGDTTVNYIIFSGVPWEEYSYKRLLEVLPEREDVIFTGKMTPRSRRTAVSAHYLWLKSTRSRQKITRSSSPHPIGCRMCWRFRPAI